MTALSQQTIGNLKNVSVILGKIQRKNYVPEIFFQHNKVMNFLEFQITVLFALKMIFPPIFF